VSEGDFRDAPWVGEAGATPDFPLQVPLGHGYFREVDAVQPVGAVGSLAFHRLGALGLR